MSIVDTTMMFAAGASFLGLCIKVNQFFFYLLFFNNMVVQVCTFLCFNANTLDQPIDKIIINLGAILGRNLELTITVDHDK